MARKRASRKGEVQTIYPLLAYQADPIRESVKRLGRKWTLLILRDMAFLKLTRFGQILRNNPGLTPRVLSRRLRQMQREGLLERVVRDDRIVYRLTSRGEDAVFILLAFLRYGTRHHVSAASTDARGSDPRPLRRDRMSREPVQSRIT